MVENPRSCTAITQYYRSVWYLIVIHGTGHLPDQGEGGSGQQGEQGSG